MDRPSTVSVVVQQVRDRGSADPAASLLPCPEILVLRLSDTVPLRQTFRPTRPAPLRAIVPLLLSLVDAGMTEATGTVPILVPGERIYRLIDVASGAGPQTVLGKPTVRAQRNEVTSLPLLLGVPRTEAMTEGGSAAVREGAQVGLSVRLTAELPGRSSSLPLDVMPVAEVPRLNWPGASCE